MKLNIGKIHTEASADFESADFDIGNKAVIMEILRGKMYSNAIKAICQEIMCNARDAHREVGKPRVPIHVTFPTRLDPTYTIRDFGPGITPERIKEIYVMYGNSTKRSTNEQTGGFGLGSKTPFAYGDTFTVISITPDAEGQLVKREYIAYIDDSRLGTISLVSECPTDEPQGTSIIVTIKPDDFAEFKKWTERTAEYWTTKPKTKHGTIQWPRHKTMYRGKGWKIVKVDSRSWHNDRRRKPYVIVDEIQYEMDISNIFNRKTDNTENMEEKFGDLPLRIFLNTGEIDIAANREQIEYSNKTTIKLRKLISIARDEVSNILCGEIAKAPNMRQAIVIWNQISEPVRSFLRPTWGGIELVENPISFEGTRDSVRLSHYTSDLKRQTLKNGMNWAPRKDTIWVENDLKSGAAIGLRLKTLFQAGAYGVIVFTFLPEVIDGITHFPAKKAAYDGHWDKMGVIPLSSLPLPKRDPTTPSGPSKIKIFEKSYGRRGWWAKTDADLKDGGGYYVLLKGNAAVMDDPKNPGVLYDTKRLTDLMEAFFHKDKQKLYGVFIRFEKTLGPRWKRISIGTLERKLKAYKRTKAVRTLLKHGRASYEWLRRSLPHLEEGTIAREMAKHAITAKTQDKFFTRMCRLCDFMRRERPRPNDGLIARFEKAYPLLRELRHRSCRSEELLVYIKAKDAERRRNEVPKSHPDTALPGADVRPGSPDNGHKQEAPPQNPDAYRGWGI
jgi:hypothetical protein